MTQIAISFSPGFEALALNEITREHPQATITEQVRPGLMLVNKAGSFLGFARPWLDRLPIYLHHIAPVHACHPLEGHPDDTPALVERISSELLPMVRPTLPTAVQVRLLTDDDTTLPYTATHLRRSIGAALKNRTGVPLSPHGEQVLSVIVAETQTGLTAYIGISLAAQNISRYPGGAYPCRSDLPSRAGCKLEEALDTFSVALHPDQHALDLGAAPGGWTTVLREHGLTVTAVDAAEMAPTLAEDRRVIHRRMHAEDFLRYAEDRYDLIVNDIIMDAQDSAALMVAYADHLQRSGWAVMTLKLRARSRRRVMDHSFRILRQAYHVVRVRQLYHNGSEVTLYLRRRS